MTHAPGWIELYEQLDAGRQPDPELVATCRSNRNGLGENILQWYALEGSSEVLQRLIDLGCDINNCNEVGSTPLLDATRIARWDNVRVLRVVTAQRSRLPAGTARRHALASLLATTPHSARRHRCARRSPEHDQTAPHPTP